MVGNPLGVMGNQPMGVQQMAMQPPMTIQQPQMNGGNQTMGMPQNMMRPPTSEIPGSSLGFQMNPVSKNSKKK